MGTRDMWLACIALSFGIATSCNPVTSGRSQPAAASQSTPAIVVAPSADSGPAPASSAASVASTAASVAPPPRWASADFESLAAQSDPALWKPRLRELVQVALEGDLDEEVVFPHLGALRDKLLAVSEDPQWQEKDPRGFSLALWARYLLSLWSDPRDAAVVTRWLKERRDFAQAAPAGLEGPTIDQALEKWRDDHFAREGVPKGKARTANWLRVVAQSGDHALAEHSVRYQHWGYMMHLVLTKAGSAWGVRIVLHKRRDHFDLP